MGQVAPDPDIEHDPERAWYDDYAKIWVLKCPQCGKWKTQLSFGRQSKTTTLLSHLCKRCLRANRLERDRAERRKSL